MVKVVDAEGRRESVVTLAMLFSTPVAVADVDNESLVPSPYITVYLQL